MAREGCFDEILISSYLDGELSKEEAVKLEQHLAACAECRSLCQQLRLLDQALWKEFGQMGAPGTIRSRLEERISQTVPAPRRPLWGLSRFLPATPRAWALAAALLLALGAILGSHELLRYREERRTLAEIDRFKAEMIARAAARNPFGLNGNVLEVEAENPFEAHLRGEAK